MKRDTDLDRIRRGTDNEALMLSLPEFSRETGIPMPVILRLKREHPEELPSVGSGSQQSFPRGVIPVLRNLSDAGGDDSGAPESRPLFSLTQRRLAAHRPAVLADPSSAGETSIETEASEHDRSEGSALNALPARIKRLAERQDRLVQMLDAVLQEERRRWFGEIVGLPRVR